MLCAWRCLLTGNRDFTFGAAAMEGALTVWGGAHTIFANFPKTLQDREQFVPNRSATS